MNTHHYTSDLLDERTAHVLAIFAERMASLAVTQQSQACALIGLVRLGISIQRSRSKKNPFRLLPVILTQL